MAIEQRSSPIPPNLNVSESQLPWYKTTATKIGAFTLTVLAAGTGVFLVAHPNDSVEVREKIESRDSNEIANPELYRPLITDTAEGWLNGFIYNLRQFYSVEDKQTRLEILSHITLGPEAEFEKWDESNFRYLVTEPNEVIVHLQKGGTSFDSDIERRITFLYASPGESASSQFIYILRPHDIKTTHGDETEWLTYLP